MSERHASSAASSERVIDAARRVSVLLPLPLDGAYDYSVPDGVTVAAGDFVAVPLGSREVIGVVWDRPSSAVESAKLKPIAGHLDAPPLPEEQIGRASCR